MTAASLEPIASGPDVHSKCEAAISCFPCRCNFLINLRSDLTRSSGSSADLHNWVVATPDASINDGTARNDPSSASRLRNASVRRAVTVAVGDKPKLFFQFYEQWCLVAPSLQIHNARAMTSPSTPCPTTLSRTVSLRSPSV